MNEVPADPTTWSADRVASVYARAFAETRLRDPKAEYPTASVYNDCCLDEMMQMLRWNILRGATRE